MSFLDAIILGIVEGFTEFLPISSTAHLVLASNLRGIAETDFLKTFIIAIQLGAIASVVVLYWKTLLRDWQTNARVLTAFVPTAIIGFLLYKVIKGVLIGNMAVIAWALIIGGIIMIFIEWRKGPAATTTDLKQISYRQAFIIGCAQSLAAIPGVSRAAATIISGLLMGISRDVIVTFSFLLAVPTMAAATGYDLLRSAGSFSSSDFGVLAVGFITSFIFGIIGIKFLLRFTQRKFFAEFGIYRILAGVAVLTILL